MTYRKNTIRLLFLSEHQSVSYLINESSISEMNYSHKVPNHSESDKEFFLENYKKS